MNCLITRQNLHKGLAAVSASIPTKTTLPVLSNILFEAGRRWNIDEWYRPGCSGSCVGSS